MFPTAVVKESGMVLNPKPKQQIFKRAYIEITNQCNLACSFCAKTSRAPEYMNRALFEKILQKLRGHTQYLYFHVMGEPLLHPELECFLDMCQAHAYKVNLTTNGTMIKKKQAILLQSAALRLINISLHCVEEKIDNAEVDTYLADVFNFLTLARQTQPALLVCLRIWNISSTPTETTTYLLRKIETALSLPFNLQATSTQGYGIKLADNIYLNQSEPFAWPDPKASTKTTQGFCMGLRNQIAILVDGTVVPCCLDSEGRIALGNIQTHALAEILSSVRAQALYQGFSENKVVETLCQKCTYRERFNQTG